jgi:adenylosuccinate lyase
MFKNLTTISPIDGRYHQKTEKLAIYFSEAALIKYRILVEIEYLIALCELGLPQLKNNDKKTFEILRNIYDNFNLDDAQAIKTIEKTTNHDVKAVEYFLKSKFEVLNLSEYTSFIHFGLTSQDINNTAIPLMTRDAFREIYLPILDELTDKLNALSNDWKNQPMLARTHGQPATPTTLGKEMAVFAERINQQITLLNQVPFAAKFGGATGNFNAHFVAFPAVDWKEFATNFIENRFHLKHSFPTTQIEHYDHLAAFFDGLKRINTILIDLNRDVWTYISMDYFKQKINKNEVGSSTMPHKINPIDFENSEGNLGIANALFEHFSAKLPISRLQRDLSDSTVLRNIGVPFAHTIIALESTLKGLEKLILNEQKINADLDNNWAVITEAIQTILRRENYPNAYEIMKDLSRNNETIDQKAIHNFIDNLAISDAIKEELKEITPFNYFGI